MERGGCLTLFFAMIINSDNFRAIPGLTSAVLAESTDGPSELSLAFMDGVPNPEFMGEVTVMHKGAVLFHGKVTGTSFSNRSGEATRTVTVSDFRWALDKQTLGEQLISAGADDRDLAAAARAAMQDWAAT